ncbi:MAG TPA: HAD hydrolase-like protein, partial [Solirubrobacteraceae bacterium]|nr:HAD hydrolase-like protein [Solirubrobacteraceae bacterium]
LRARRRAGEDEHGVHPGLEAGMHTVLVLTGSTTRAQAERFPYRPSRIVESIADLLEDLR